MNSEDYNAEHRCSRSEDQGYGVVDAYFKGQGHEIRMAWKWYW